MVSTYLSLGTNLGEKKKNLVAALKHIEKHVVINKVSSLYASTPWGYTQQNIFYNQVIHIWCNLLPQKLLYKLQMIEKCLGKHTKKKWGPRIIDIDILYYGKKIINSPTLKIPHPYLPQRKFVLVPLHEIDPQGIHPQLLYSNTQMLLTCKDLGKVYPIKGDKIQ